MRRVLKEIHLSRLREGSSPGEGEGLHTSHKLKNGGLMYKRQGGYPVLTVDPGSRLRGNDAMVVVEFLQLS